MTDEISGLHARHISKTYKKRTVVCGISMNLQRGEIVGLLGPNGSGKTTTFSMITGLIQADSGDLFLDNQNISPLPMYRRARLGISYLPQESSIFRNLNVADNIMTALEVMSNDYNWRIKKLDELLAEFSITHLKYVPAIALSGGERRRLEIARTIATNPQYILLDEPLAGIDPVAVTYIKQSIKYLSEKKNIGVLITDHNVRELLDLVDRAYIIYDGKVLMEGQAQDIIEHKEVQEVYLGDTFKL